MDLAHRIETALQTAVGRAAADPAPPKLKKALHHAVFPGGARVRPSLCLAVAGACGDDAPGLSDAAAAAIELMHCASLVHDDLPCFDDADIRRGQPTVHRAFGEPLAVLVGDGLIVAAFETLAAAAGAKPLRLLELVAIVGRAVGSPVGLVAGQAWESERFADLSAYQQAKTGSLFVAATMAGAVAAGADPGPWRAMGEKLGEAYQVADDVRDAAADPVEIGKPVGCDVRHDRPNAVTRLGLMGALARLTGLLEEAADAVPPCRGEAMLRGLVMAQGQRLVPKGLVAAE